MPLLLSFAAAIGLSLAAVFTPSPEQPPQREAFTWDGMHELLTSDVPASATAHIEGSTSRAGESGEYSAQITALANQ